MTQQQYENRKERAENEPLVIARTDEGFRVYSPSNRIRSYIVSGSVQAPSCTCPDFQYHDGDASWRCKHILAVLAQYDGQFPKDACEDEERRAIQEEGRLQEKEEQPSTNGTAQMLLKRSVSPDGRIDSLSVEFSCAVDRVCQCALIANVTRPNLWPFLRFSMFCTSEAIGPRRLIGPAPGTPMRSRIISPMRQTTCCIRLQDFGRSYWLRVFSPMKQTQHSRRWAARNMTRSGPKPLAL